MRYLPWALALVAIWLIGAPFLLGYAETERAMQNDVGIGSLMLMGALVWGYWEFRGHGWSGSMRALRRN